MQIDICSDLHVDTYKTGVASVDWATLKNPGSEVLVIAGDTANQYDKSLRVVKRAAACYAQVVFVDGNHEHYETRGSIVVDTTDVIALKVAAIDNATYLDDRVYQHGRTAFVGCNGWYDFRIMCPDYSQDAQYKAWRDNSNDIYIRHRYRYIGDEPVHPTDVMIATAEQHAERLRQRVVELSADPEIVSIVVVTHTAPLRPLLDERPGNLEWQMLNGAYANSAMKRVMQTPGHKVRHWVYGHSHLARDVTIAVDDVPIRFLNNARGYRSEQYDKRAWRPRQIDTEEI